MVSKINITRNMTLLIVIVVCSSTVGCGSQYDSQVYGTVTLDGIPLERGVIAYYPKKEGPTAHGVISTDGEYSVMTGRENGIPPGEYDVTVVSNEKPNTSQDNGPPSPGMKLTPEHLSDRKTTDLHYTVEPGNNQIDLSLTSQ